MSDDSDRSGKRTALAFFNGGLMFVVMMGAFWFALSAFIGHLRHPVLSWFLDISLSLFFCWIGVITGDLFVRIIRYWDSATMPPVNRPWQWIQGLVCAGFALLVMIAVSIQSRDGLRSTDQLLQSFEKVYRR
jgi:hypothetical protein